jgi:hypothetical protein
VRYRGCVYRVGTELPARHIDAGAIGSGRVPDRSDGLARWASAAWLIAGVLLWLVMPFTVVVIKPTNTRLLSADLDKRSDEAHRLLARWNRLHGVRTALSVVALVVFLANG